MKAAMGGGGRGMRVVHTGGRAWHTQCLFALRLWPWMHGRGTPRAQRAL